MWLYEKLGTTLLVIIPFSAFGPEMPRKARLSKYSVRSRG